MKMRATFAVVSSALSLLVAGCVSHRAPVVYTTPSGEVIAAGANARTAADRALETSLQAELNRYGDLAYQNREMEVYARNGVVTLSGPVRSDKDRQMITTLARNTPGVVSINDQLRVLYPPTGAVVPPSSVPAVYPPPVVTGTTILPRVEATRTADEALARRISDELRTVPADWMRDVNIRVNNGAAYVQGFVTTQSHRETIDAAIQRVTGVTAVYDQVEVR